MGKEGRRRGRRTREASVARVELGCRRKECAEVRAKATRAGRWASRTERVTLLDGSYEREILSRKADHRERMALVIGGGGAAEDDARRRLHVCAAAARGHAQCRQGSHPTRLLLHCDESGSAPAAAAASMLDTATSSTWAVHIGYAAERTASFSDPTCGRHMAERAASRGMIVRSSAILCVPAWLAACSRARKARNAPAQTQTL